MELIVLIRLGARNNQAVYRSKLTWFIHAVDAETRGNTTLNLIYVC